MMLTHQAAPSRGLTGFLHQARQDSLVRNSVWLMLSAVITSALGYLFWAVAAHTFTRQDIGVASAVISLCSTSAMLTYLGPSAMLVEWLPPRERSSGWTRVLVRVCVITAVVTVAATAAAIPFLLGSPDYHGYFRAGLPVTAALAGAGAWTLINLFAGAFIAARQAGRYLSMQIVISVAKLLLVLPAAAAIAGAAGLVAAWVTSAVLGVCVGAAWLIPRMRLGRPRGRYPRRQPAARPRCRLRLRRRARHRRPASLPSTQSAGRLLGQHLTSVGGAVTPLCLPVLVVLRLGATQNAYFYIAWLVGGIFFMVSPSVASALFAEGVRAGSDLRMVVFRALRVIAALLCPAMVVTVAGGKLILALFGAMYATAGYGLLVLLAVSAIPDAVSNIAVAVCRVTNRLVFSAAVNLAIFTVTLAGAWVLLPGLGIAGAGVAWLGAQTLGALASVPVYAGIRGG